ncbi:MAG: oxygen-independent coproporphyrinogen III oxidase [Chthoniobacterales bacterium]
MRVDLDLIRKYNVPAPRYTSYPPATHFKPISEDLILERLDRQQEKPRPLSLYFHLPFCRALCWFCGCTNIITTQQIQSARYLEYLECEIEMVARRIHPESQVVQIHLGGGTPTFFLPEELHALGRIIRKHFKLAANFEGSVEIDPRQLTPDHVTALRDAGFRRASLGVQDFDPSVQAAIHRIQPYEQTSATVDWLRAGGFDSINIDLIYGLPFQKPQSFENTLDAVLTLQPDRLAVFNYAHVPWMKPAQTIFKVLPTPEEKMEILARTVEKLTSHGHVYIGMDHFARTDDELAVAQRTGTLQRNFQGYSTCGQVDIHAFGMSAISQANGTYWQNHKDLPGYYAALDANTLPVVKGYVLTEDDLLRRQLINRLMCDMRLDFSNLRRMLGVEVREYFGKELASLDDLAADGLLELRDDGLLVTPLGRLLVRNIAVRFDAYASGRKSAQFSKAI